MGSMGSMGSRVRGFDRCAFDGFERFGFATVRWIRLAPKPQRVRDPNLNLER